MTFDVEKLKTHAPHLKKRTTKVDYDYTKYDTTSSALHNDDNNNNNNDDDDDDE